MASSRSPVVAVIGGGAAGLMAALWSARGGAETVLLEGSQACGLKILISGGGRCNVLPDTSEDADFFAAGSRNVLRRLFRTWRLAEVRRFFEEELELPLVLEEETGKLFPECQAARPVRDRLVQAVEQAGARIRVSWRVAALRPGQARGFEIASREGERLRVDRVIIATGGASLPRTGSDGAGYGFVERLGHSIIDTYPALVSLTSPDLGLCGLTGIAVPVRWRALLGGKVMEERRRELLFTHRGFSGPAILDASHWVIRDGATLEVSWGALTPEEWQQRWRADSRKRCLSLVQEVLPRRLAALLLERARIAERLRHAQLNRKQEKRLLDTLCGFALPIGGNQGYRRAEVTGGGLPLGEVNPSTLESRVAPGLYLCGEIFDVIGRIGGYNFLWAWVTGRLAGENASKITE